MQIYHEYVAVRGPSGKQEIWDSFPNSDGAVVHGTPINILMRPFRAP